MKLAALIEQALDGNRRALSRLITLVENGGAQARAALAQVYPRTGRAHILGVTGAPGTGKSTLVNQLAQHWRAQDRTIAVLAVDPTSPFSGGAILGDRIRMQALGGDPGCFIRSMASRGSVGGLARATGDAVKVLDAAGYEIVIVETVGAGQAEVEITREAHTVIVVEVPGMGDDIQAIKAGILEIADVFVVNKADREGADRTLRQLQTMLHLGSSQFREGWEPPIIKTVASSGTGVPEAAAEVDRHWAYLHEHALLRQRETERLDREWGIILREAAITEILARVPEAQRTALFQTMLDRQLDPYAAAALVVAEAFSTPRSVS